MIRLPSPVAVCALGAEKDLKATCMALSPHRRETSLGDQVYNHPDYTNGVSVETLRSMKPEQQTEVMSYWFHENYEDPANHTPYESAEGGAHGSR